MRYYICTLIVLSSLATIARGGDKPQLYLTGNPKVDFFGPRVMLDHDTNQTALKESGFLGSNESGRKSPWLAALMSAVVPGAGEVYAGSYLKGAAFFVSAASSWAVGYVYNGKGDRQTDAFEAFANQHYSVVRYVNWTLDHLGALSNGNPLPETADQYRHDIYDGATDAQIAASGPPFRVVNWEKLHKMEDDISRSYLNGYTHELPYWNQQQYYELIGKYDQFSRGWDDSNPNSPIESAIPMASTSKLFYIYAQSRADANHQYDVAATWVSVALLTHLASAIDAYWSVTRFNSALHADVNMYMQPTQAGMIPVGAAQIRYDF